MLSRELLIKFIPEPTNTDVITYNTELKDLIDVDVMEEYNKIFPIYTRKKEEYDLIKAKLDESFNGLNNIYLLHNNWTKEDYLQALQNDKKTYSILYKDIKKIENNISTLQNKVKVINDKIQIQIAKENKEIEEKKKNIDDKIEINKLKISNLKSKLKDAKDEFEKIQNKIKDNQEEFELLSAMDSELTTGNYKCKYCGSTVKVYNENSLIYKRLYKNLENNKKELESLIAKNDNVQKEISQLSDEYSTLKVELNNDIEFKKQNFNFYLKKTVEVLKLEGFRDEAINNIEKLQKELKSKPQLNSKEYQKLKENIDKYELSLTNLNKISELKEKNKLENEKFLVLRNELNELYLQLKKYKEFLSIYFKIYEQKANLYFGNNFKFNLFKFDDFKLIPFFELKYNDIEYSQLNPKSKEEVDKIFAEKVSICY